MTDREWRMADGRSGQRPRSVLRGRWLFGVAGGRTPAVPALLALLLVAAFRPTEAQSSGQAPLTPFEERKARVLLATQLPCLGCHELDGEGGRIGPSLTTVGARRSTAYIDVMVRNPQYRVPGAAMPRTLMPESTASLVIRFLSRAAGKADAPAPGNSPPVVATPDGAMLYAKWCASCHGARGRGDGVNARYLPVRPASHSSAAAMGDRPDDSLYDTIAGGGGIMGRSPHMPAFGGTLASDEMRALVAQIRTLCKCAEPVWARRSAGR